MAEIVDDVDQEDKVDEVDQATAIEPDKSAAAAPAQPKPKPVAKAAAKGKAAAKATAKPVVKASARAEPRTPVVKAPEPEYTGPRVFSSEVAALAILAARRMHHRFHDENDNEAERQTDGSVRLSIKVSPEVGHERVWVRVPDQIELEVIAAPDKISPE